MARVVASKDVLRINERRLSDVFMAWIGTLCDDVENWMQVGRGEVLADA